MSLSLDFYQPYNEIIHGLRLVSAATATAAAYAAERPDELSYQSMSQFFGPLALRVQQTIPLLTQPAAIPFALAFIGGFFIYHIHDRRRMLAVKAAVDALYGVHFWMMQAYAGAYGIMIAVLGGLVQVITPDRLMRRTMVIRNIIAVILALLGIFVAVQHTTDLLPLIGAAASRFIETQSRAQNIRIGMAITLLLWLAYTLRNDLVLMTIAHITLLGSMLVAIYRHRAKTQPVT